MNVDKMGPETLREGIRLEYPHYDNFEWAENRASWGEPKDTFSVPTGKNKHTCLTKIEQVHAKYWLFLGSQWARKFKKVQAKKP